MNPTGSLHDYIEEDGAPAGDAYLVRQVAQGNGDALEELYRRYSAMLFNFLCSLVGDPAVAEDVLQEVFIAVWKGSGSFRSAASVKTWLFNIAYKRAVSWLRRRRDLPIDSVVAGLVEQGVETTALQNLQIRAVQRALMDLSPQHRAVIELALFFDCAYAEIAEILGCPVGTVKSRMSYARQHLQSLLLAGGQIDRLPE